MTFQFHTERKDTLCTIERHSHSRITYCSKHKMEELYPKGSYEVIGEIGNFKKRHPKLDEIITDTNKHIPIFPRGTLKRPFEWVSGYASVGESIYVAVIKSMIPVIPMIISCSMRPM